MSVFKMFWRKKPRFKVSEIIQPDLFKDSRQAMGDYAKTLSSLSADLKRGRKLSKTINLYDTGEFKDRIMSGTITKLSPKRRGLTYSYW